MTNKLEGYGKEERKVIEMSQTKKNTQMIDYRKYRLNPGEFLTGLFVGMMVSAAISFLFFWNWKISAILAIPGGVYGVKIYRDKLQDKRNRKLLLQFRDFLEGMDGALSSGNVVFEAFKNCYRQLCNTYGEDAYISLEVERMIRGTMNGQQIMDLMNDFAMRSGLEDIKSFVDVFDVTVHMGGNVKDAVSYSRKTIGEKIEAEMNIKTKLAAGKQELMIMMVLPLIVLVMSGDNFTGMAGNTTFFIVKCVVMIMYITAYVLGRRLLNVKV